MNHHHHPQQQHHHHHQPHHLNHASGNSYCDMTYNHQHQSFNSPMRMDQEQQQQQLGSPGSTTRPAHLGPQLQHQPLHPTAAVSVLNGAPPVSYQGRHVYEEYAQQPHQPQPAAPPQLAQHNFYQHHLYVQPQPQQPGGGGGEVVYRIQNYHHQHFPAPNSMHPYATAETHYGHHGHHGSHAHYMQQVDSPIQQQQQTTTTSTASTTNHHHHPYDHPHLQARSHHPNHYHHYNVGLTMQPQDHHHHQHHQHHHHHHHHQQHQQHQSQHPAQRHHHHQDNYSHVTGFSTHHHPHQHHQQQPVATTTTLMSQNTDEYAGGETAMLDQVQLYQYQPHLMDTRLTIKQQQEEDQQQQQQQVMAASGETTNSMSALEIPDASPVPISTTMDPYNAGQMCAPLAVAQQPVETTAVAGGAAGSNLARPETTPQTATTNQLNSRSKSDLESSSVQSIKSSSFEQRPQTHQRSLSSTISHVGQQLQQPHRQLQQQKQQLSQQQDLVEMRSSGTVPQDWLDTICRHLIEHMDRFGICVIDNFLGSAKGDSILKEVHQLYNSGQYTKGRLVGNKLMSRTLGGDTDSIRGDRVIWIDGCEDGCSEINNLIQTLCSVITNSARLSLYSNNGLDKTVINKRTKAHVACYPGNGTKYIKHVDNPNGDGRVITSIYYLNKDWNTKRDGGLLRMFPVDMDEVANIEPLFDRVLFFWSDRRNPHEVLPAYKDRFAITVWYIGESRP